MYSDVLESPSKGCFSFNDHIPPPYDMDEMNETSSLDYICESLYTTRVSLKYDTGFELPEDCNNMSFSELFDQELLNIQENKDCNITNGTELEKPIKSCSNGNDSLDTTNRNSLINVNKDISISSSITNTSKKGINRTLIKNSENCDIMQLMDNPFCETEDNFVLTDSIIPVTTQKSIDTNINTKQNTFDSKTCSIAVVRSRNSVDSLQNNIDNHTEVDRNVLFSPSKMSTLYTHNIDSTFLKTTENNIVEDKSHSKIEHMSTEIGKYKSVKTNESILEGNAVFYSGNNSFDTTDNQKFIKVKAVKKNYLSQLSNNYALIGSGKNKTFVKPIKRCGIKPSVNQCFSKQNVENIKNCIKNENFDSCTLRFTTKNVKDTTINHNKVLISAPSLVSMSPQNRKSCNKIKDHQVKQIINKPEKQNLNNVKMSTKVKTPLANCKSKLENCQGEQQNIVGVVPSTKSKSLVKTIKTNSSSKNKSFSSKCHKINRTFNKTIENHDDQNLIHKRSWNSKIPSVEQSSVKIETPTTKSIPKIIIDVVKQKIVYSSADSQKKDDSKIQDDFVSAISQILIPKRKSTKQTSIKTTVKHDEQIVKTPISKIKNLSVDQTKALISEPINQVANPVTKETSVVINKVDSKDLSSVDLKHTNIKKQEVIVEKEENKTSFKNNDTNSQTIIAENEKKKITWEEFKAKREKMGISSTTDNNENVSNDNTTEIKELESIKKEFDRNTVAHFTVEKRLIEDLEEKTNVQDKNLQEVIALQNKRLKIEYFQKLKPSSIASEIAKITSSKKGILQEDNENDSTSNDSAISCNETKKKYGDTQENLVSPKNDEKSFKKYRTPRVSRTRPDIPLKTGLDGSYHYNDAAKQVGHYSKNCINPRSLEVANKVVYVGQIPIKYGKPYLQNRFKTFGNIQSITIHKKPDFRVYYAFVTFNDPIAALQAIKHGNDDKTLEHLDIRYGERKQTHTPYYDLDDEWLTDWYGYNNQSLAVMRPQCPVNANYQDELKAFTELANKKSHQKLSQGS